MPAGGAPAPDAASGWPHAALVASVLAAGVALRAVNLGDPAFGFDEFYDVFAAKSFLAGEGFRLPHGGYTRGRLATLLTAAAFAAFGRYSRASRRCRSDASSSASARIR